MAKTISGIHIRCRHCQKLVQTRSFAGHLRGIHNLPDYHGELASHGLESRNHNILPLNQAGAKNLVLRQHDRAQLVTGRAGWRIQAAARRLEGIRSGHDFAEAVRLAAPAAPAAPVPAAPELPLGGMGIVDPDITNANATFPLEEEYLELALEGLAKMHHEIGQKMEHIRSLLSKGGSPPPLRLPAVAPAGPSYRRGSYNVNRTNCTLPEAPSSARGQHSNSIGGRENGLPRLLWSGGRHWSNDPENKYVHHTNGEIKLDEQGQPILRNPYDGRLKKNRDRVRARVANSKGSGKSAPIKLKSKSSSSSASERVSIQ